MIYHSPRYLICSFFVKSQTCYSNFLPQTCKVRQAVLQRWHEGAGGVLAEHVLLQGGLQRARKGDGVQVSYFLVFSLFLRA